MPPISRAVITYVVYFTAVGAAWPYLPVYYRDLGLDLGTIGFLAGLSAATQLVAAPAWGGLTDRYPGSRLTLPAAALLASAGAFGLFGARELPAIAGSVLVLAAGLAGIGPLLDARALDILGAERARYGEVRAWGSAAFIVTAWLVGLLIDRTAPSSLFAVYIPALVLTAPIALSLTRRAAPRAPSVLRGAVELVRRSGIGLFLVGTLLVWTMLNAVNSFYSIQIVAFGAPATTVGLAWAVGAAVEVPIMWGFARLAGRFGTGRLLVLGASCMAIRAGLAALATDAAWLVLIAPLEGVAFGLYFVGGVTYVSKHVPPNLAATGQGVWTSVAGLAAILGSSGGGLVAGALTIRGLFAVGAIASALAAVVVALAVRSPARATGGRLVITEEVHP